MSVYTLHNYWPDAWIDIRSAITNVWPRAEENYRLVQSKRINWSNLIEDGEISVPYVVVHAPPAKIDDRWGLVNSVFLVEVSFYYIVKILTTDTSALLEKRMKEMHDYLLQDPFSTIQILDIMDVDCSDMQEVASGMLGANQQLTGGGIGFSYIVGQSVIQSSSGGK